jgi:Holliday junction DNA helicase RuvA
VLRDADAKGLKKAPGVGPKLAERIAVELRDDAEALAGRVGADDATGGRRPIDEAAPEEELLSALVNLGYPPSQAERVVASALSEAAPDASLEELIRVALRRLAS